MQIGRFTSEQILGVLEEAEQGGATISELCRKHNINRITFYRWRKAYGGPIRPRTAHGPRRSPHQRSPRSRGRRGAGRGGPGPRSGARECPAQAAAGRARSGGRPAQAGAGKTVVTVAGKRRLVRFLVAGGLSQRRGCRLAELGRSTFQYRARTRRAERDQVTADTLQQLAARHPRYGYRRIWALVRRQGAVVNRKRVARLWRHLHLQQPPRPRTRRRARPTPDAARTVASYPGHVWSYDFVQDACLNGTRFRLLPVLDEFTRECLAIDVATSVPAARVVAVLKGLFATGAPACLRSDNGPEFMAEAVQTWLATQHTSTLYIAPGHPWENGITERFNGTLRDECLNQYAFASLAEARRLVERFRQEYNDVRPHSELGYRTPAQFKRDWVEQHANAAPL